MRQNYKFKLNPLPYRYDDMEPYIGQKTMKTHHIRHLGAYVSSLNRELARRPEYNGASLTEIYSSSDEDGSAMRYLSAAVYNHNFFFSLLAPSINDAIRAPVGCLRAALAREYGSVERALIKIRDAAIGSTVPGWVFLCKNKKGRPEIVFCNAQSMPDMDIYSPILVLDTWEHAYYLDYLNAKKDYIENNFRLINWNLCEMFWNSKISYK